MKKKNVDDLQLRYISSKPLSEEEGVQDTLEGYQMCISPNPSGSNLKYQELLSQKKRFDTLELYTDMLSSTALVCLADLIMVSLFFLDYHLRRNFLERLENSENPAYLKAIFIGESKLHPFKGTTAEQVRYIYLLRTWKKLSTKCDAQSSRRSF